MKWRKGWSALAIAMMIVIVMTLRLRDEPARSDTSVSNEGEMGGDMAPPVAVARAGITERAEGPTPQVDEPVLPQPRPVNVASLVEMESETAESAADLQLPPVTVLENVRLTVRQYASRFGENPVGDNAEITAALNGGNAKQIVFLKDADGLRIDAEGRLVDNWSTPFFFHQLSRTEMEIHSAGPDRRMWTSDDLVLK